VVRDNLVNVIIHQFQPGGHEQRTRLRNFRWATYRKLAKAIAWLTARSASCAGA
jgi:hypothetical protein